MRSTFGKDLNSHMQFGTTAFPLGDDITDESVFAVLEFAGCGYAVGRPLSGARGTLESPQEVRSWLASLANQSTRTS
jgi:trehalose-6-phosphatase